MSFRVLCLSFCALILLRTSGADPSSAAVLYNMPGDRTQPGYCDPNQIDRMISDTYDKTVAAVEAIEEFIGLITKTTQGEPDPDIYEPDEKSDDDDEVENNEPPTKWIRLYTTQMPSRRYKLVSSMLLALFGISPQLLEGTTDRWYVPEHEIIDLQKILANYHMMLAKLVEPDNEDGDELICFPNGGIGIKLVKTLGEYYNVRGGWEPPENQKNQLLSNLVPATSWAEGYYVAVDPGLTGWLEPLTDDHYYFENSNTPSQDYCSGYTKWTYHLHVDEGSTLRLTELPTTEQNPDKIVRIVICPTAWTLYGGRITAVKESGVQADQRLRELLGTSMVFMHELAHAINKEIGDMVMEVPETDSDEEDAVFSRKTAYGWTRCVRLALSGPEYARQNADTYVLFALTMSYPNWSFESGTAVLLDDIMIE